MSEQSASSNIYEEDLNNHTTWDLSSEGLKNVPTLKNNCLCIIYLQNNEILSLPDDFFKALPHLMYLDLRDNELADLPKSLKDHQHLTHLLLQNNKLTSLPNELGTVTKLIVLQLTGNPLTYPPKEIINAGTLTVKQFLNEKYIESVAEQSEVSDNMSTNDFNEHDMSQEALSYNSVIDGDKMKKAMSVQLNEKETEEFEEKFYPKTKGKCPKLAKSRFIIPPHYQSSKYVKPSYSDKKFIQDVKIRHNNLKGLALKRHKEILAGREKILQKRKDLEQLGSWRKQYRMNQCFVDDTYKMDAKDFPYDTHPDYMTLLTREDIEKDLPDKYRKRLLRRSKPTVPRKNNNDVHLALKIKQLFENLEAIDLNRSNVTPRTEQKMLLNEIQKISEIKQKLTELSSTNTRSVAAE